MLYVDNGSNYSSLEISQVCQRLGTILCHTPVRDGAAKGKIERSSILGGGETWTRKSPTLVAGPE